LADLGLILIQKVKGQGHMARKCLRTPTAVDIRQAVAWLQCHGSSPLVVSNHR